jgi:hypothetical protein
MNIAIAAYYLVANDTRVTNLLGERPVVNMVQSSFFFCVLLLIWYLGRELCVKKATFPLASVSLPGVEVRKLLFKKQTSSPE